MKYRIVWTDSAIAEFDAIVDYILLFDAAAAARIAERLWDCGASLAEFPDRGTPIGKGQRQLSLVYPYLVRYRVLDDRVEVISIRHGARAPD